MTSPVDLQPNALDGAPAGVLSDKFRRGNAATANGGGRHDLKSPPELDVPLDPVNLIIQALHLAGEFVDGLDQVLKDIVVRALLLRLAKKSFRS